MNPKILIVPLINKKEHGVAIQRKVFSFDLKVSNESDEPSPEFNISNIKYYSDKNQNLVGNYDKEFYVGILNPGESRIIEIGKDGQIIHGLARVEADIKAKDHTVIIDVLQKHQVTKDISRNGHGRFIDFFYVRSLDEVKQEKSTKIMILLTIMIGILAAAQLALFFIQLYNAGK